MTDPGHEPSAGRPLGRGSIVGRYEVLGRLASGGMAELVLARVHGAEGFAKLVAIKRILPHLSNDEALVSMFLNEARLAATLDHPNVAQVIDFGESSGEYYLAMEYVHGRDLGSLLRKASARGNLPLDCALTIAAGIAAGLHHAHECKDLHGRPLHIVHRDVSPSNVLVTYDGGVKVIDFGIARAAAHTSVTQGSSIKGKVGYMSPEQCQGHRVDRRSDIFLLGVLLYELTTLERQFVGDNQFAIMNQIANGVITRPTTRVKGYPPELEAIVLEAMATDPEARYPTAEAFQKAVEDFAHAQHLQLSSLSLRALMRDVFGEVPMPSFTAPSVDRLASEARDRPPENEAPVAGSRGRSLTLVVATSALVVGALGGVWLGRARVVAPEDQPAGEVGQEPSEDRDAQRNTPLEPGPPLPAQPPEPDDSVVQAGDSLDGDGGTKPAASKTSRKTTRTSTRRRPAKSKRSPRGTDKQYDPSSLFPPD